jgi:Putative Ig domain
MRPAVAVICALVALAVVSSAAAFRFTDGTRLMPAGLVGQPYHHRIEFAGGCKGVRVQIDSGGLPPGLQLVGSVQELTESSDWRIEGVPTTAGSFRFWLRGRNLCPADSTEEPFSISIGRGVTVATTDLPTAVAGRRYAVKLAASPDAEWRWALTRGALPAGLALTPDGTLAGTPTKGPASHELTVRVEDGAGRVAERDLVLNVAEGVAVIAPAVPAAEVGRAFSLKLAGTGGAGVYAWRLSGLPAGLRFDAATTTVSGVPARAGTFPVEVAITDSGGRSASQEIELRVAPRLRLEPVLLPTVRVGQRYRLALRKLGGAGRIAWRLQRVRPLSAIRVDRATGVLTFTPRAARRIAVAIRVGDGLGAVATRTYRLDVLARRR